ncbi:9194_t:CDS:2, partial [Funneliformis geosporum]
GKRKAQYCDLEGQDYVVCDYEKHKASIISEQVMIPSSSQHLNLLEIVRREKIKEGPDMIN